jgi:hypothetical protein
VSRWRVAGIVLLALLVTVLVALVVWGPAGYALLVGPMALVGRTLARRRRAQA